ncbi:DUF1640 domain-containing protein [candidate division KSB1 bacterium]|nr:DUF1640 domain-containing protein [candidate division KSB1 bacterium]MBL7095396.1 DUF1640 domain-containing protein [candidate division KSB1 bacterium]
MQGAITFDIFTYAKELMSAGFTEKQAEVQVKTLARIIDERLATKQDILALKRDMKELEASLKRDMKEMEVSLKHDMKEMDTSLRKEMGEIRRDMKEMELRLKHDLTIRLGVMMAAGITIVAALGKLL